MPEVSFRRALMRSVAAAAVLAAVLLVAPVRAQDTASTVNDEQVRAFFNGIEQDRRVSGQSPAAEAAPAEQPVVPALEARRTAGLEGYAESRARPADDPPGPLATILLSLAGLGLLALAAMVVALVLREARKDARQRSLAHRRRLMSRSHSHARDTPATAS